MVWENDVKLSLIHFFFSVCVNVDDIFVNLWDNMNECTLHTASLPAIQFCRSGIIIIPSEAFRPIYCPKLYLPDPFVEIILQSQLFHFSR